MVCADWLGRGTQTIHVPCSSMFAVTRELGVWALSEPPRAAASGARSRSVAPRCTRRTHCRNCTHAQPQGAAPAVLACSLHTGQTHTSYTANSTQVTTDDSYCLPLSSGPSVASSAARFWLLNKNIQRDRGAAAVASSLSCTAGTTSTQDGRYEHTA